MKRGGHENFEEEIHFFDDDHDHSSRFQWSQGKSGSHR